MKIFPAIDLLDGQVVRLKKGDYNQKTVYSDNPLSIAKKFKSEGAEFLHVVDLDGARDGKTKNTSVIKELSEKSGLKIQVGGGIRSEEVIKQYLSLGVNRVILGTVAITNPDFLEKMVLAYKDKIAVGVDILNGFVATHGWTKTSDISCNQFIKNLCRINVKTIICTDISKDGLLKGTNLTLYQDISNKYSIDVIASGGVTGINEIKELSKMHIYGAIIGKALYTGDLTVKEAVEVSKNDN